ETCHSQTRHSRLQAEPGRRQQPKFRAKDLDKSRDSATSCCAIAGEGRGGVKELVAVVDVSQKLLHLPLLDDDACPSFHDQNKSRSIAIAKERKGTMNL